MSSHQYYHGHIVKSRSLGEAFRHAVRGIGFGLMLEPNVRRQTFIVVLAIAAGLLLQISALQLVVVVLVSAGVLAMELVNSAVEALADAIHPDYNEAIQRSKDMAAGAVLLVSFAALIVGLMIFGPPLLRALEQLPWAG